MMLFGIAYHGAMSGLNGVGFSMGGLVVGICIFIIPYMMGGMGAGDAKLMGGVGAILGPKEIIIAATLSAVLGFFYAIVLLVIHLDYTRSFLRRIGITVKALFLTRQFIPIPPGKDERKPALRFALPMAFGIIFYASLKVTRSNLIQDLLGFQFTI